MADDTQNLGAALAPEEDLHIDVNKYANDPDSKALATPYNLAMDQPLFKQSVERRKTAESELDVHRKKLDAIKAPEAPDYESIASKMPMEELKDESAYAQNSTPWFMLMTVLGGFLGSKNARVAVQAQADIVTALNAGNKGRYLVAKQRHDDALDQIDREYKNRMEVFRVGMEIYKGQIDAEKIALQMADRAVGAEEKTETNMLASTTKAYEQIMSLRAKKFKDDATLQLRKEMLRVGAFRAGTNASKFFFEKRTKLLETHAATDMLYVTLKEARDQWQKLLDKKEKNTTLKLMQWSPIATETINALNTMRDPDYAKLNQILLSMKEQALTFNSKGLAATAQRIKAVEVAAMAGLPSLEGKTPEQVTQSMDTLLEKLDHQNKVFDAQEELLDKTEEQNAAAGFGQPTEAPTSTPPPAAAQQPAGGKKPMTEAAAKKYYNDNKESFDNYEEAKKYLEAHGRVIQ